MRMNAIANVTQQGACSSSRAGRSRVLTRRRKPRRWLVAALLLGLCGAALVAEAQPAKKVPKIGYLDSGSLPGSPPVAVFRDGLRELGYVEGQNVTVEYRWAEGRYERLPDLAAELVRLEVDVNVKTAKALGLTIRPVLLLRADHVIE